MMREQQRFYEQLREKSDYYPEVLILNKGQIVFFSTLVRIYREGQWMIIHCVDSMDRETVHSPVRFALDFGARVYYIQHLYRPNGSLRDLDKLQEDETQRLENMMIIEHEEKQTIPWGD
jgi:hypothetical protein